MASFCLHRQSTIDKTILTPTEICSYNIFRADESFVRRDLDIIAL